MNSDLMRKAGSAALRSRCSVACRVLLFGVTPHGSARVRVEIPQTENPLHTGGVSDTSTSSTR